MKKIILAFGLTIAVAAAGTAFALYFEGSEPAVVQAPLTARSVQASVTKPVGEAGAVEVDATGTDGRQGCSCCGTSSTGRTAGQKVEQLQTYLVDYFSRSMGNDITVEVRDLGCHHEADISKDGRIIKRLSISGNTITDIT